MSKWKDKTLAEFVVAQLSQRIIHADQKNPTSGWTFSHRDFNTQFDGDIDRFEDLLVSNARFDNDVPNSLKHTIIRKAIFMASDKNKFHTGVISEFIKSQERDYLKEPKNIYYLLTTLSIPYTSLLNKISINSTQITFCKRKPKHFENEDTNNVSSQIIDSKFLQDFTYVKVRVEARCQESAFVKSKTELDLIRGIWNFTINMDSGIRQSFGVPDRINKIVYGPCHTLHMEDGTRESSMFWYETHISRKVTTTDITSTYNRCKKHEKYIRSIIKNKPLGKFIKTIFIRYANSLDDEDMTNTFTRLWSLLELITKTEKATYAVTIKRASLIFKDKKFNEYTLDNLRNKRNQIIHSGGDFGTSERDAHVLLGIIDSFICFIVNNIKFISTQDEYLSFLSLPLSKEEMDKQKTEIEKSAQTFDLANKLSLYK